MLWFSFSTQFKGCAVYFPCSTDQFVLHIPTWISHTFLLMRLDGVVSCQHRRLVLVTLDRMGGYMCFLFLRENKILGDEKNHSYETYGGASLQFEDFWALQVWVMEAVSLSSESCCHSWVLEACAGGLWSLTKLTSVWQWPGPQLHICRRKIWFQCFLDSYGGPGNP